MPTAFKKQLKAKHVKVFFHYGYAYWLRFSQTPSPPALTATAQELRHHQLFLLWNKCESLVSLWSLTVVLKQLLAMTQILKIKDKTQHLHVMQSKQQICCFFFYISETYETIQIQTPLTMPASNTV